MSNGNFGVQIAKQVVLGTAASVGILIPWFVTGYLIKKKIKNSLVEKTDAFIDMGDKFMDTLEKKRVVTSDGQVPDDVKETIQEFGSAVGARLRATKEQSNTGLSRDAATQTFPKSAEEK